MIARRSQLGSSSLNLILLSDSLLPPSAVRLFSPLGLVFQHGKLDFLLHVVNAVNDHANFVADGVGLL
jgi:hypothetical protein